MLSGDLPYAVSASFAGVPRLQCAHGIRSGRLSALVLVSDPDRGAYQPDGDRQQQRRTDHPELDAHCLHIEHAGYYEISYATAPGGPFTVYGQTADKTVSSATRCSVAAARVRPTTSAAHGHRTPHGSSPIYGDCYALPAEHGDQRVQRGGGQRRWRTHADPHAHADGQPDRHGDGNADRDRHATATPTATLTATTPRRPAQRRRATATGTWTPTATPSATATPTASATPSRLWLPLILR
jgi:hypothetical protein